MSPAKKKEPSSAEHDRARALVEEGAGGMGVAAGPDLGLVRVRVTHGTTINVPDDSEDPKNTDTVAYEGDDEVELDARTAQSLALVGQVEIIGGAE